jgi:hypothetical protein
MQEKIDFKEAEEYYKRLSSEFRGVPSRRYIIFDNQSEQLLTVTKFGKYYVIEDKNFISKPVKAYVLADLLAGKIDTSILLRNK